MKYGSLQHVLRLDDPIKLLPAGDQPLLLGRHRHADEDCLYLPEKAHGVVVLVPSPEYGAATQGELVQALLGRVLGVLVPALPAKDEDTDDEELSALVRSSLDWLGRYPPTLGLPRALLGLGRGAMAALNVCVCRPC